MESTPISGFVDVFYDLLFAPGIDHCPCSSTFFGGITVRSFTISPARISPATDGTNAMLPGIARRFGAFMFRARRTDTVLSAADAHVFLLLNRLLRGVNDF